MPTYCRDYMHCSQDSCNKKDQCYRYWLGQEIKNSGFQYASFYHPEKPVTEGCSYKGEKHFKQHKTIEDAEKEYQQIKRATIKNEATKLYSKHLITEKVYRALIKYALENLA